MPKLSAQVKMTLNVGRCTLRLKFVISEILTVMVGYLGAL
jgi:hypothetical protein